MSDAPNAKNRVAGHAAVGDAQDHDKGTPGHRPAWVGVPSGLGPTAIALSGLLLSGSLTVTYSTFYDALGLRPSDVGLTYASVLPSACGLAVVLALLVGLFAFVAYRLAKPICLVLGAVAVVFFLVVVGIEDVKVHSRIAAVRAGEPVAESRFGPLVLLSLHAEPVTVTATDPSKPAPALPVRDDRPLLLLGQANAMFVVYDSLLQQAVYLPASSVIVRATGCRAPAATDPRDIAFNPSCPRLHA